MKKKILIVCKSFYPENTPRSFRATELAKEFSRQGHKVTVIAPKNDSLHRGFEMLHGITIKDLGKPKWKEIPLKGKGIRLFFLRLIKRFSNLLIQYPDIQLMGMVRRALRHEVGYDLLVSIAVPYPVHWGVARSRSQKNKIAKTWVADCGDPFMGQENDTFKKPFYFKYVEKWFCGKADFISVPTSGAVAAYYPEFRNKIKVIPQGFNFNEITLYRGEISNKKPKFAYAGLFIQGRRDPSEFLKYLLGLERDFEFNIYTSSAHLVKPFVEKFQGRIVLHEHIPRKELLYELSKMDFVVNFENVGNRQTPSKLIDYAIINKPIMSVKYRELNKEIIDEFLSGDYKHQYKVGNIDQYRIENVTAKFLDLLN